MGTVDPTVASTARSTTASHRVEGAGSGGDGPVTGPARPRAREVLVDRSTGEIKDDVCSLVGRLAAGTYELLVLIGELDQRGAFAAHGSLSCAAWLADLCDLEISTARSQVRVARLMRQHPVLDRAMAEGDVSYSKARVLAGYLTAANAESLVRIAAANSASNLGAAIATWSLRNDDEDEIENRQFDMRSASWRTEPDGCVVITARLPPVVAAEVCAVIDAQVNADDAPAGAALCQQRADALAAIVTGRAGGARAHGPAPDCAAAGPDAGEGDTAEPTAAGRAGPKITAEVIVHVTEDGNHLPDGTPLSDNAVTAMLPDSFVSLLIHDSELRPIDATPRRRVPTRRQRRVLDARQTQCAHPGCTATVFLQADHIEAWARGGSTTLDNLQLLCGPHNRAKEAALRADEAA